MGAPSRALFRTVPQASLSLHKHHERAILSGATSAPAPPIRRDQRVLCFAARAFGRPFSPLDHARSASQSPRSSRAAMDWPHQRQASVCGSAAALRSGFVPAVSPPALHFPRSPTADRSLMKIEKSFRVPHKESHVVRYGSIPHLEFTFPIYCNSSR